MNGTSKPSNNCGNSGASGNEPAKWEEVKIPMPHGFVSGKWWGSKLRRPLVALHGWQDNAGTWDRLVPLLGDVSVLAVDLPGHGLSDHFPPGQNYYLFWDGVVTLRRIVKHYNWPTVSILGHSLGGAIGFLYAGAYPDQVDSLVSIDIVSPTVREPAVNAQGTGESIDRLLKYERLTQDSMPCYQYQEMIDLVEIAYRGSVTRDSCEVLMKRGMAPSPNGDGYLFARDVRLKVAGLGFLSMDLVLEFARRISCRVLNIRGDPGMSFDNPANYTAILDTMRENAEVEFHIVKGTHHLHLNDPGSIAGILKAFLERPPGRSPSCGSCPAPP